MFISAIAGAVAGPLIGGLLGSEGSSQSQSTQQTLDPRMEGAIYGDGGLLSGARDWYSQNRAGLNNQMLTGMNNQWMQHAASGQGFNQMQNMGMGLMGQSVAGNPFAGGYSGGTNFGNTAMAAQPQPAPQYQPAQPDQQYQPAQPSSGAASPFTMPVPAPAPAAAPAAAASAPAQERATLDWWTDYINNSGSGS